MNYPSSIKKSYKKITNYANRGMDLENLINIANDYYLEKDLAVIYKKPTPIQVVKYDYNKKRITDAYYKSESTLDYNGIYKGKYIEFDAKMTTKDSFPLSNIANHQIKHIKNILNHNGIIFLIVMIQNKCYILKGTDLLDFMNNNSRKSIPLTYFEKCGILVECSYLKGVDYLKDIDIILKEEMKLWEN